jgi:hypothetical protein
VECLGLELLKMGKGGVNFGLMSIAKRNYGGSKIDYQLGDES